MQGCGAGSQVVRQPVGKDGAQDRAPNRTAQVPPELDLARGHAHELTRKGHLHGGQVQRERGADAEADHDQVRHDVPLRRPRRDSTNTKPPSMIAARASSPVTWGEVQAWSRVIVRPISKGTTPAASVRAPQKSMSRHEALERTYGRPASTTMTAMMPTGMFTSNTHLQLQWSVMKPPVVGPTIELRPKTAPKRPCARPRWSGGKRSPMAVNAVAKRTAPT